MRDDSLELQYAAARRWAEEQNSWWGEAGWALVEGCRALAGIDGLPERLAGAGMCGMAALAAATDPRTGRSKLHERIKDLPSCDAAAEALAPFERQGREVRGSAASSMLVAVHESAMLPGIA